MNTAKTLEKLNRKYPASKFTECANAGDWAAAAIWAAKYGMWGVWAECAEIAGQPTDPAAQAAVLNSIKKN